MMKPCTGLASAKLCPQCQYNWTTNIYDLKLADKLSIEPLVCCQFILFFNDVAEIKCF